VPVEEHSLHQNEFRLSVDIKTNQIFSTFCMFSKKICLVMTV